jgi:hypothetical protein
MSIQLSNKINNLCYKLEKLSHKGNVPQSIDKAYLFAVVQNETYVLNGDNPGIPFDYEAIVPYNKLLNSKNITLNMDGSCKIDISGVYRIAFKIHILHNVSNVIQFGIKVNDIIIEDIYTTEYLNNILNPTITSIDNNIILSLNAGDVISIVNSTITFSPTNYAIFNYIAFNRYNTVISIEKID